jgi:DNA-directed RNA polymerase specialized sigma24 family protein
MSDEKLQGVAVSELATTPAQTEAEIATQAAELLQQGTQGRELAAMLLYRKFERRIMHYFVQNCIPQMDAEELVLEVIVKFVNSNINQGNKRNPKSAIAFLWQIVHRELIDWIRANHALKRSTANEVHLNEDDWESIVENTYSVSASEGWVKSGIDRASARFQHERPALAELLSLIAEGYSIREIAGILNGIDDLANVTPQQEDAAKARIRYARKMAQEYFQECKE